jgi:hypothetical protein
MIVAAEEGFATTAATTKPKVTPAIPGKNRKRGCAGLLLSNSTIIRRQGKVH